MLLFVLEQYCLPSSTTLPYLRVHFLTSLQYSLTSSTTFYITLLYFLQFQTTGFLHRPVLSFTFENLLLPFSNPVLLAHQCLLLPSNINYTLVHQFHLFILSSCRKPHLHYLGPPYPQITTREIDCLSCQAGLTLHLNKIHSLYYPGFSLQILHCRTRLNPLYSPVAVPPYTPPLHPHWFSSNYHATFIAVCLRRNLVTGYLRHYVGRKSNLKTGNGWLMVRKDSQE